MKFYWYSVHFDFKRDNRIIGNTTMEIGVAHQPDILKHRVVRKLASKHQTLKTFFKGEGSGCRMQVGQTSYLGYFDRYAPREQSLFNRFLTLVGLTGGKP